MFFRNKPQLNATYYSRYLTLTLLVTTSILRLILIEFTQLKADSNDIQ